MGKSSSSMLFVPTSSSNSSEKPSLSSSSSELLPIPSSSVSVHSLGSNGNASMSSSNPSPSVSIVVELEPLGGLVELPHTFKLSEIKIFTVAEALFPDVSVTEKTISLSPKLSHKSFKGLCFFRILLKLVLDIVFAGFLPKGVGFQKLPIQRF